MINKGGHNRFEANKPLDAFEAKVHDHGLRAFSKRSSIKGVT